jgi:FixJ family two-component response regulator
MTDQIAETKKYAAVLVDDDALVRMSWKLIAKNKKLEFLAFEKPDELMKVIAEVPKDTPIYLDSNLGGGIRGEQVAVELHQLGFTELFIATGYEREQLSNIPSWIRGVVGKEPPWLS